MGTKVNFKVFWPFDNLPNYGTHQFTFNLFNPLMTKVY